MDALLDDVVLLDVALGVGATATGLILTGATFKTGGARNGVVFAAFARAADAPAARAITQTSAASITSFGRRAHISAHLTHGHTTVHPQHHPNLKPGGSKAPSRETCGQSLIVTSSHQ